MYWQETFRCFYNLTTDSEIPLCPENVSERKREPIRCRCTGTESLESVPTDTNVAYVQDAVTAYANALDVIKTVIRLSVKRFTSLFRIEL